MLDLTAALSLIPYLLAAAYALKLTLTRETYGGGKFVGDMVIAAVATVYTLFLIYATGVDNCRASWMRRPRRCTSRHAANAVCVCSVSPRRCCSA